MRTVMSGLAAAAAAALTILELTATAAAANPVLLFEPATGQVLYAEEPDRPWHPASVTKLMTAYLTFEAVKGGELGWDADVPLSEHARAQPATRIGLRGGIRINIEQAVRGLILRSANDFATALAERVGGTEEAFVARMNRTATRLGMTRTHYENPHGLPNNEQVTTARDLAILTTALLRDFPDRAEVFSTPTVQIHKGTFHSQNDLLRTLEGADGMKTGFTCSSGYNVVASATRNDRRLIAIVLGAPNRTTRSARATELIEAGFAHIGGVPGKAVDAHAAGIHADPAKAETSLPKPLQPVALKDLPVSPAEPATAYDMSHETRTRKCGNSERPLRRAPKAVAKAPQPAEQPVAAEKRAPEKPHAEKTAHQRAGAHIVTGSVTQPAKPRVKAHAQPKPQPKALATSVTPVMDDVGHGN